MHNRLNFTVTRVPLNPQQRQELAAVTMEFIYALSWIDGCMSRYEKPFIPPALRPLYLKTQQVLREKV